MKQYRFLSNDDCKIYGLYDALCDSDVGHYRRYENKSSALAYAKRKDLHCFVYLDGIHWWNKIYDVFYGICG